MDALVNTLREAIASLGWLPAPVVSTLVILGSVAVVLLVHGAAYRLLLRQVRDRSLFWRSIVARTRGPTRLALVVLAVGIAAASAPIPAWMLPIIGQGLTIAVVGLVGWFAAITLHVATVIHLRRYKIDQEDNLLARKHVTQLRILERAGVTLVVLITVAIALMTIEPVRQYGVSLLASAGAAGLILGLAMQPVLTNLVAGIQIAITQPIRIEDAIIVEGEWGWVEEITSTYVVVRLWDWRRLVLPLTYFIQKPFQNWTREGASLIGSVYLYLDHTAPIDQIRSKLAEILSGTRLWDGRISNVQVSDARDAVIEVRLLLSARNAPQTWDLRCEVREKMITYLAAEHPGALPRHRAEIGRPDGLQVALPERGQLRAA